MLLSGGVDVVARADIGNGRSGKSAFTYAFFEALLWSSTDTDDEGNTIELDRYSLSDIADPVWNALVEECDSFVEDMGSQINLGTHKDAGDDGKIYAVGYEAGAPREYLLRRQTERRQPQEDKSAGYDIDLDGLGATQPYYPTEIGLWRGFVIKTQSTPKYLE